MTPLNDIQLFMLEELQLDFDLSQPLTLTNWQSTLEAKSPSDCIATILPPAILMNLAENGFTLCTACVDFFSGDFYVKSFDHQQLNSFLPYPLPVESLRMVMVNRHTGTLTILSDSAWPLLTVSLYDDFGTWSALINLLYKPNSALPPVTAESMAIELTEEERYQLETRSGLLPRLLWLVQHIDKPIHRFTAIMTLFPTSTPGTPFFTMNLNALSKGIATSNLLTFDDYNPNVIIKSIVDIKTEGAA